MTAVPEVQYARNRRTQLAWTQHGEGPDVLVMPGLVSNVELGWENEVLRRVLEFCGRHARIVQYDKRGMGLSDRSAEPPSVTECVADALAVLDAAGVERCGVLGISEGGVIAQALAARYPERVERLALANSLPGRTVMEEPEWADFIADRDEYFIAELLPAWGRDANPMLRRFAQRRLGDEAFTRWMARFQRQSATPHDLAAHGLNSTVFDAYDELPSISCPTLVANCRDDLMVPPATGDAIAARIPGSERSLIDNGDHFFWFTDEWLAMAELTIGFLVDAEMTSPTERRFATVVFTDIVGSTASTSSAGDGAWSDLLDRHDQVAWRLADQEQGTIVKSTGDGLLARFDTPSAGLAFAAGLRAELAEIGLPIRAGLHTGEIEIRHNRDITGIAVNLAARVEQAADDGSVFVSSTVRDMMLGGSTDFIDRGEHDLKGIDGRWRLYEVANTTG